MSRKTTKVHKKKTGENTGLTMEQERFCEYYVSKETFANGTLSYADAYGYDITDLKQRKLCEANASRLLSNAKVLKRLNELLELNGLNDEFVDKQLLFVIMQNVDFSSKVSAIREYNKLRSRITEKIDTTISFTQIKIEDVEE